MLVHKGEKEIPNWKFKIAYRPKVSVPLSRPPFSSLLCPPTTAVTFPYSVDGTLRHKTIRLIDPSLTGHQKGMQSSIPHALTQNTMSSSFSTD